MLNFINRECMLLSSTHFSKISTLNSSLNLKMCSTQKLLNQKSSISRIELR